MFYKGLLFIEVFIDLFIYCWYELVSVYGIILKELIYEEFGDGIMSVIDFFMDL